MKNQLTKNFNYEERIVAFIDILGFENIIKSSITSQDKLENLGNAITYIHDYFKEVKSTYPDPSILQLSQFNDFIDITVFKSSMKKKSFIFESAK
jgi:hypothetical protein